MIRIKKKTCNLALILAMLILLAVARVFSTPAGPTITYAGTSTAPASSTAPSLESNASITGGYIATVLLNTKQQDTSWKAYIGNVTGTLALADSSNYSIYEWTMAAPTGEVYATRDSTTITWSNVVCANITHVAAEQVAMGETATTTPTDSINITFDDDLNSHWGFQAGTKTIAANSCNYSINTWVNGSAQQAGAASNIFEEVLLYDGTNIVYTSRIQKSLSAYHNNTLVDFQMLVAENASAGASRMNYYFYVELV